MGLGCTEASQSRVFFRKDDFYLIEYTRICWSGFFFFISFKILCDCDPLRPLKSYWFNWKWAGYIVQGPVHQCYVSDIHHQISAAFDWQSGLLIRVLFCFLDSCFMRGKYSLKLVTVELLFTYRKGQKILSHSVSFEVLAVAHRNL